jgi:hypothetical protein
VLIVSVMFLVVAASIFPAATESSQASPTATLTSILMPAALGASPGITPNQYWPESIRGTTHFDGGGTKNVFPCGPAGTNDERAGTVNVVNGEFVARFTVMGVKNDRGPDFEFNLTYRSLGPWATHANLSTGWDFRFGKFIEASGADYYYHDGEKLCYDNADHFRCGGAYGSEPPQVNEPAQSEPSPDICTEGAFFDGWRPLVTRAQICVPASD